MAAPGGRMQIATARPSGRVPTTPPWFANRLTIAFLLDIIGIGRGPLDLIDSLLVSTITQANVVGVSQSADLQVAFADFDSPPPDELRRPISINALASSLRLPFETVRRRVRRLVELEVCVEHPTGLVVPAAILTTPRYLEDGFRGYERFRSYYYALRQAGALPDLPAPSVELAAKVMPARAVLRLGTDFVLRAIDTITEQIGGLLDGLILLQVDYCNIEHQPLPSDPEAPSLDIRTPVRPVVVAQRLGLPYETIRRHVAKLEARGLCVRVSDGLLVPESLVERESVVQAMASTVASAQRMMANFSRLGVLQLWDAAPDAPAFT